MIYCFCCPFWGKTNKTPHLDGNRIEKSVLMKSRKNAPTTSTRRNTRDFDSENKSEPIVIEGTKKEEVDKVDGGALAPAIMTAAVVAVNLCANHEESETESESESSSQSLTSNGSDSETDETYGTDDSSDSCHTEETL